MLLAAGPVAIEGAAAFRIFPAAAVMMRARPAARTAIPAVPATVPVIAAIAVAAVAVAAITIAPVPETLIPVTPVAEALVAVPPAVKPVTAITPAIETIVPVRTAIHIPVGPAVRIADAIPARIPVRIADTVTARAPIGIAHTIPARAAIGIADIPARIAARGPVRHIPADRPFGAFDRTHDRPAIPPAALLARRDGPVRIAWIAALRAGEIAAIAPVAATVRRPAMFALGTGIAPPLASGTAPALAPWSAITPRTPVTAIATFGTTILPLRLGRRHIQKGRSEKKGRDRRAHKTDFAWCHRTRLRVYAGTHPAS